MFDGQILKQELQCVGSSISSVSRPSLRWANIVEIDRRRNWSLHRVRQATGILSRNDLFRHQYRRKPMPLDIFKTAIS